ncbi:MAG: Stk1 family PASTA domain-containing Ser/Thr kinase [Candidatus Eremiobacteraeota bacterium]|nr:Stk1 family PASTA domain-containing Ser/Thr kinase [Candidatus Eremiobacteraeota bacterium]
MDTTRLLNNRYRIETQVGSGGMALVYVGTDTLLRRRVAIKVLRDQYASDDDFVKRFSYEAQSAAKLSHPNIVNIYDFGREESAYYIVMELVDGTTLAELLHDEPVLPEPVAIDYAIQIASGLAYAHRQGLLHRDVKPANILVTKDDVVKLSDFGIARAVSEHTLGVTQPGMVMGSVSYISPEQAQNLEIDERSDLYSVGVVLYQMLTGRLPFSADTPVAVALKHVAEPPPPIDPASGVSPAVAAIVARLLRKDPAERFSSATELASTLREARERPLVAHGPSLPPELTAPRAAVVLPPRRSQAPDRSAIATSALIHEDSVRQRSVPPALWVVMPLLLLAAVALGFYGVRRAHVFDVQGIAVPSVAGMSASTARERLIALGLRPSSSEEPSDTVLQGHVIRQDPAGGAKVAKDAAVALVVSSGLPRVAIPDVKSFSAADALRTLQTAKLRGKVNETYSASVPSGQVIDVAPPVGASVRVGATVALTVSKGVRPIVVPDLHGANVDAARRRVRALGLLLTVQPIESDGIPANTIASQDPQPGSSVAPHATVLVQVSTGPATLTIPKVVGNDPEAAQSTLRAAGFNVAINYSQDAANPTGKVSLQQPEAGAKAKKGSNVQIFVSVAGSVPDVTGMTLDDARRALIAAGYQPGNVAYTQEGNVQEGQVVRTEPEANSAARPGDVVTIMILHTPTPPP